MLTYPDHAEADMAARDAEIVEAAFEALNHDGVEAALAYLDPEVEWLAPPEWLEEHLYKGHEGVRKVTSIWREAFDEYHLDVAEIIEAGDGVLALVTRRGRIKRSGDPIAQRIAYVWKLRDGR